MPASVGGMPRASAALDGGAAARGEALVEVADLQLQASGRSQVSGPVTPLKRMPNWLLSIGFRS